MQRFRIVAVCKSGSTKQYFFRYVEADDLFDESDSAQWEHTPCKELLVASWCCFDSSSSSWIYKLYLMCDNSRYYYKTMFICCGKRSVVQNPPNSYEIPQPRKILTFSKNYNYYCWYYYCKSLSPSYLSFCALRSGDNSAVFCPQVSKLLSAGSKFSQRAK